ncbi:MAG: hypothetical protein FWE27_04405 [Defluviitaleaceae bacterium]|nr:hypothetical protein [Defluviitaleaceae bacterium]
MKIHNIPLESFSAHGRIKVSIDIIELLMTATATVNSNFMYTSTPIKSYIGLSEKYKLPFSIDMTVKIDSPSFYLIIGKGHIGFGTGMDNRRITDILGENIKPNTHEFDNRVPVNEYVRISVMYGSKAMWVRINDEIRCFSKKDPYIKAMKNNAIPEEFLDGFGIALACDKRTQLTLKSFTVTEFQDDEPDLPQDPININVPPVFIDTKRKGTLEECIDGLTPELRCEIVRTDEYLLADMKKTLKIKRKIEGGYPVSKITYVSQHGFSYKIFIDDSYVWHEIGWIDYNTKREQEKHGGYKKADYTIETFNKLAETDSKFANEMFMRVKECSNCAGSAVGAGCMHINLYEFNGMKNYSCGGKLCFNMFPKDFEDLREIVACINDLLSLKPVP